MFLGTGREKQEEKNGACIDGSEGNHTGERGRDECHVNVPRGLTSQ